MHDYDRTAARVDAMAEERGQDEEQEKPRKSASTLLVEMALDRYQLGISTTGEAFAIPRRGPRVVAMLRGAKTSLRGQLARTYFRSQGKAAAQQSLADALLVLEGMSQEADEIELYLRVARVGEELWLDIGDATGRAVRVTADGWGLEPEAPVLFKRTPLTAALPEPARDGSLEELWSRLNVAAADRPLIVAWCIAALDAAIPHPVLALLGEQGTGKTSAARTLVSLVDPSPVPVRKPPRDAESWVTAAAGSWVVALDNISDIAPWLSDSICRAVTGEGDVRRRLYTDGELATFAFRRAIILNSIDPGALRGDLAERLLPARLDLIPDERRLAEEELWPSWHDAHPRILGALLDVGASVARVRSDLHLASSPRMADFARVVAAVDEVLGGDGMRRYLHSQRSLAADSLAGDLFIEAVLRRGAPLAGTGAELLEQIAPPGPAPKGWPPSGRAVTQRLRRFAPALRKAGWTVGDDGGANHRNTTIWQIAPPRHPEFAGIGDSRDSHPRGNGAERESASVARQEYEQSQDDLLADDDLLAELPPEDREEMEQEPEVRAAYLASRRARS